VIPVSAHAASKTPGDRVAVADPPALADRIPASARAVAFRNLLIHGYAAVDDATVWRTVQEDLPG
jgi:hypothetical protein